MEFLKPTRKEKVLRTVLYGDQEIRKFELEVLHTPLYQRLYDLKQLGFTDRVFPDAVHSRFNHLIGVAEVSERIAKSVMSWLQNYETADFQYMMYQNGGTWTTASVKGHKLRADLYEAIPSLRLMALLHDLTHAAFGHTLEDEVRVFKEKHDEPARQRRFFDALVAQLILIWAHELGSPRVEINILSDLQAFEINKKIIDDATRFVVERTKAAMEQRDQISSSLRNLERAFRLLLSLDATHINLDLGENDQTAALLEGADTPLLISHIRMLFDPGSKSVDLEIYRDMYLIDIIGNTICSDLLDYARRDTTLSGLKVAFDDRVLRYLGLVSTKNRVLIPGAKTGIRLCVQIYTDKMRHDVLSELSAILKARYLISERIVFHPTKCAVGAGLGTAVQLIGFENIPAWIQALGDIEFLEFLMRCAQGIVSLTDDLIEKGREDATTMETMVAKAADVARRDWPKEKKFANIVSENFRDISHRIVAGRSHTPEVINTIELINTIKRHAESSLRILWKFKARRYPKLAYRLPGEIYGAAKAKKLAGELSVAKARYLREREIETYCKLPLGTVYIHCPRRDTNMKIAEAIVVGNDLANASHLRNLAEIYGDRNELKPYQEEIRAIEQMYRSIWRVNVYVDNAHVDKRCFVALVAATLFEAQNDPLLANETENFQTIKAKLYRKFCEVEHEAHYGIARLPDLIEKLDKAAEGLNYPPFAQVDEKTLKRVVLGAIEELWPRQLSLTC